MNYFIEAAFKDKDHWKKILIVVTVVAAIVVKIVESFSGEEILDGYLFNGVVILGAISLIVTAVKGTIAEKDKKRIPLEQEIFENKMRLKFQKIIKDNPQFQTFCYECANYDSEKLNCRISFDIINKRVFKTKFPGSIFEYCLYWKDIQNNDSLENGDI